MASFFKAAAAFGLAAMLTWPAAAQSVRETGRAFRDWREGCEPVGGGRDVCFIFQQLSYRGRPAANLTVGYKADRRGPVAVINLPLGAVLLPEGVRIVTDQGVDGWAPVRFCDQRGCHVETELEPALLQAMQAGVTGALAFRDLAGQEVRLALSFRGFTAGLNAIRR